VDVRVDAQSRDAYVSLRPDTPLAKGRNLAAAHHGPCAPAGPIYVMEKLADGWSFSVVAAGPNRRQ
jgi:hypothetical protein